jgi:thioesterase domain-containing protein
MKPKNVDDIYPLTPMQQIMLTHALAAPDSPVLSTQFCYRIRGPLDVDAFRESWNEVVRRHPALRTAFIWEGLEQPLQAGRSKVTVPFEVRDLREADVPTAVAIRQIREEDQARRYSLTRAPLLRLTLARLDCEEHLLVWNVHHLVADRWSLGPLLDDLQQAYAHRIDGRPWTPPTPPAFRTYLEWIREQPRAAAEAHWRSAMRHFRHPTLLGPTATRRGGHHARSTVVCRPAAETLARVRATASTWRVGAGSPILTAIAAAVSEECGRADVVFGLTVSGRPVDLPGAEGIVGSFINNLPIRVDLSAGDEGGHSGRALQDVARGVHAGQARRQPFEHVSLADIRTWCDVPASSGLFDLLVVINLEDVSPAPWPGIEVRAESGHLDGAYPFVVGIGIEAGELVLSMTSGDPVRAERFLAQVSRSLERIASGEAIRVADLVSPHVWRSHAPAGIPLHDAAAGAAALTAAESVLEIWREVLGTPELSPDDDLLVRGATSLQIVQAHAMVGHRLGRTPPVAAFFETRSVRGLIRALGEPVDRRGSLVPIRASGRRPQLFAVPGIGGNVVSLSALARTLSVDQPFYGLQSKGLDGLDTPRTDIETIAREFVADAEREIRGTYVLLGICWGAAVAFEMAHMLTNAGRPPALLALLDPADIRGDTGRSAGGRHRRTEFLFERLRAFRQEIRAASLRESGRLVLAKVHRAKRLLTDPGTAHATRSDFHRFSVEQANLRAVLAYRPSSRYRGDGVLFLTRDRAAICAEARLDWLTLIEPTPHVQYVPGSTVGDVLSPENVSALAEGLRVEIDRVVATHGLRGVSSA